MDCFKNLENNRLLPVVISSLAFIVLCTFSGNLVQFTYADSTYTAAGDWGCTSNTDATVTNMAGKNPERVFALGDYSYASTGTCWFNKIGSIDVQVPGVSVKGVRDAALRVGRGGVGYYPRSKFIHLDSGPFRWW